MPFFQVFLRPSRPSLLSKRLAGAKSFAGTPFRVRRSYSPIGIKHLTTVPASGAKTKFGELLDRVLEGEEIVITKDGKPVARLIEEADRLFELAATLGARVVLVGELLLTIGAKRCGWRDSCQAESGTKHDSAYQVFARWKFQKT